MKIHERNGRFYIGDTDKWFGSRAKAEAFLARAGAPAASTKRATSSPPGVVPILARGILVSEGEEEHIVGGKWPKLQVEMRPFRHLRPFVVIEVEPGKPRPFYRSTGRNGGADDGEWAPFGGLAPSGWLIKTSEFQTKDGRPADAARPGETVYGVKLPERYKAVSRMLSRMFPGTDEQAAKAVGGRLFNLRDPASCTACNEMLWAVGAIAPKGTKHWQRVETHATHMATRRAGEEAP